ncbi:MAG TPA: bifunctional 2-polyprenyl-6-hydroxyphenol methylase/3-demethylubiquinol 3-O-methyltransferase UbiG [Aestuariivirga sp.]
MINAINRKALAVLYGVVCHSLFVISVGMMIFQMYYGLSRCFGSLMSPWSIAANALLAVQFPLAHSALLSKSGRKILSKLAPVAFGVALAPTTYVIIASLQVLALFSLWSPSGVIWWQATGPTLWLLSALYAASWLLLGKAILDAGIGLQSGSIGWLAVFQNRKPQFPAMPTAGLFRSCRQPIYLAFACTLWTVPIWTPDQLALAIPLTLYCLIGPIFKEARFSNNFGQAFADYKSKHPYFLPLGEKRLSNDLSIYDTGAEHWWDGSQRWLRALQNIVPARFSYFDQFAKWQGVSVLDLGCGGGFMAEALAQRGAIVTGIDPAQKAIAAATKHAAQNQLMITYHVGNGENLQLADASMDVVVCVDVLEHVIDLDRVLREIHRVLKPRGLFCFDTINRNWLATFVIVFLGEHVLRIVPKGTHDQRKFIRPQDLAAKLQQCEFSQCSFQGLGPVGFNQRLDPIFGKLPFLTLMYMGQARR